MVLFCFSLSFFQKCVGVNDITFGHIVKQKRTSPTNQSGFAKSSNNVDYNVKNDETFSVRGTLASNIKVYLFFNLFLSFFHYFEG